MFANECDFSGNEEAGVYVTSGSTVELLTCSFKSSKEYQVCRFVKMVELVDTVGLVGCVCWVGLGWLDVLVGQLDFTRLKRLVGWYSWVGWVGCYSSLLVKVVWIGCYSWVGCIG